MGQDDEYAGSEAVELRRADSKKREQYDRLYRAGQVERAEQVEVAQRKAKVAFWGWMEKSGVPFFSWAVAGGVAGVVAIIVFSLLAVGIAYVCHILGWVTLSEIKEVKSFLSSVFTFLGGAVSTSLLFYLNRKRHQ